MTWPRRLITVLALVIGLVALVRGQPPRARGAVVVAEFDGIIHPIAAEYLAGVIDAADTSDALLVVIVLRTPGGLLDSTRAIVSRMIT